MVFLLKSNFDLVLAILPSVLPWGAGSVFGSRHLKPFYPSSGFSFAGAQIFSCLIVSEKKPSFQNCVSSIKSFNWGPAMATHLLSPPTHFQTSMKLALHAPFLLAPSVSSTTLFSFFLFWSIFCEAWFCGWDFKSLVYSFRECICVDGVNW